MTFDGILYVPLDDLYLKEKQRNISDNYVCIFVSSGLYIYDLLQ